MRSNGKDLENIIISLALKRRSALMSFHGSYTSQPYLCHGIRYPPRGWDDTVVTLCKCRQGLRLDKLNLSTGDHQNEGAGYRFTVAPGVALQLFSARCKLACVCQIVTDLCTGTTCRPPLQSALAARRTLPGSTNVSSETIQPAPGYIGLLG